MTNLQYDIQHIEAFFDMISNTPRTINMYESSHAVVVDSAAVLTTRAHLSPEISFPQVGNVELTNVLGGSVLERGDAVRLHVYSPLFPFVVQAAYVETPSRDGQVVLGEARRDLGKR